jgi:hypothetical protein
MKELPKMYRNKIEKEITNNEKLFSTIYNNKETYIQKEESNIQIVNKKNNYTVEQKIANIFNSPNYIYKIDVVIVTDKDTLNKRIVGKTKTNLITIDNEYIPINTIRDIYIKK